MQNERFLIDYLPPFMQRFQEIQQIMKGEQPEIDNLWGSCQNTLDDQFVMSATENGVKRWEKIVGITPKSTDTLDERKFRIISKMNQELPYTIAKLKESLTTLCGEGGFSVDLQAQNYHIDVKLALSNKNNYNDIIDLLTKMLPANLTKSVQIMYNTHSMIGQFKHTELTSYTHKKLREDVF